MFKILVAIIGTLAFVFGIILLATVFVWMGWNWGLVLALAPGAVREINLVTALFLTLFVTSFGGAFRSGASATKN